ncbi:hypothetical protein QRD40_10685 [Comamonas sp. Y6]|uniref:Uncharacterized protein n=1 Tax=Comamonas resistens TaxID=3046670 RepID=A0ABY8SVS1_9BURK|nr:hypothetical protein [Comamonas resistens]MDL5036812.1 hypothetical protein [Comamonas resistens]WHS67122.1 hypothetical protein QMY55_08400 [Comamonas resistens]
MSKPLNPCPNCQSTPERFFAGGGAFCTEVIACSKGCMERHMRHPVHIRSADVKGWDDLADAWNTGTLFDDGSGRPNVQFDQSPPGNQVEFVGPYNNWSPAISDAKIARKGAT